MSTSTVKCFYCRLPIHVANAAWVGDDSKRTCKHSPDKQHARQVVHEKGKEK